LEYKMSTQFPFKIVKNIEITNIDPPSIKSGILLQHYSSYYLLPGHENNGDTIIINPTVSISYYNSSRTLVWSKSVTDILAGSSQILIVYFSSVDDIYYVITYGSSSNTLSTLNKTTGAVTNLNTYSFGFSANGFTYYGMSQLPSTNNLLYMTYSLNKIVELTNTGTIVSNTAILQNSIDLYLAGAGLFPITYRSADGTIFAGIKDNMIFIARGGMFRTIFCKRDSIYSDAEYGGGFNSILNGALLTEWNGYVAVISRIDIFKNSPRFFIKADFDSWLNKLCTEVGI